MMPVSMVGRTDEVDELVRAWSGVARREPAGPRTAVITGAAGIGKSLLVAAALDAVAPRPATVLSGTARVHTPAPYDWLAAILTGRDTQDLPVPVDALAWLAQQPTGSAERYAPGALLRLAVRVVRALVGAGPAVLVVEDLHALDPASLNMVGELAAAPDLPALLLVTSRPPDVAVAPELVARTLARLSGVPGAIRQHLSPLTVAEVGAVLAQVYPATPVPRRLAEAVCGRTGGNPYWLMELLAAAAHRGPAALAREPLPRYLAAAPATGAPGHGGGRSGAGHRAPAGVPAESGWPVDRPGPTGPRAPADRRAAAALTAREVEVLTCLAAGMSNKQVARSLGISIRTVAVHVSNLLRKTGSASRTEAALWAVRHQLTSPVRST